MSDSYGNSGNYQGYGQQGGVPSAPPVGYPSGSPAVRPKSVDLAVKLMWAMVGLSVLGALVTLLQRDALREQLEKTGDFTTSQIDTALAAGLVFGVVFGLVFVALWALNAVFAAKGANWARIFATVLAALSILGALAAFGQEATTLSRILSLVSGAVAVGIIVMLWRKESSAFFKAPRY